MLYTAAEDFLEKAWFLLYLRFVSFFFGMNQKHLFVLSFGYVLISLA